MCATGTLRESSWPAKTSASTRLMDKLPPPVVALLRSSFVISTPCQAVIELVMNSLDAGATRVDINLNLLEFSFAVTDNGSGISKQNLEHLGARYFTSKCHDLADLMSVSSFGWRGEALASLCDISIVEIISRSKDDETAFEKIIHGGNAVDDIRQHPYARQLGTSVKIKEIYFRNPVRQKLAFANAAKDALAVQRQVEAIALIHPEVYFSIVNKAKGSAKGSEKAYQIRRAANVEKRFLDLFNICVAFHPFVAKTSHIKLEGLICSPDDACFSRDYQFVYVNRRRVSCRKIVSVVDFVFSHCFKLLHPGIKGAASHPAKGEGLTKEKSPSKAKSFNRTSRAASHPAFVLSLACNPTLFDMLYDPAKTLVTFQDLTAVLHCVFSGVKECFSTLHSAFASEIASLQLPASIGMSAGSAPSDLYSHPSPSLSAFAVSPQKTQKMILDPSISPAKSFFPSPATKRAISAGSESFVSPESLKMMSTTHVTPPNWVGLNRKFPHTASAAASPASSLPSSSSSASLSSSSLSSSVSPFSSAESAQLPAVFLSSSTSAVLARSTGASEPNKGQAELGEPIEFDFDCDVSFSSFTVTPPIIVAPSEKSATAPLPQKRSSYDFLILNSVREHSSSVGRSPCGRERREKFMGGKRKNPCTISDAECSPAVCALPNHSDQSSSPPHSPTGKRQKMIVPCTSSCSSSQDLYQPSFSEQSLAESENRTIVEACNSSQSCNSSVIDLTFDLSVDVDFDALMPLSADGSDVKLSKAAGEESKERTRTSIREMFEQWAPKNMESRYRAPKGSRIREATSGSSNLHDAVPIKITRASIVSPEGHCLLHVIAQIDAKFILCLSKTDRLIIIVDQHAADERRRLEELERNIDFHLSHVWLNPPLMLRASNHEVAALQRHSVALERWGFKIRAVSKPRDESTRSRCDPAEEADQEAKLSVLSVERVPTLFGTALGLEDLIEFASLLVSMRSRSEEHIAKTMPPALLRLLHSKSCRGAIMFGDILSIQTCIDLVENLVKCQFPFNCAHGRPTMSPLVQVPLYQSTISRELKYPQQLLPLIAQHVDEADADLIEVK